VKHKGVGVAEVVQLTLAVPACFVAVSKVLLRAIGLRGLPNPFGNTKSWSS